METGNELQTGKKWKLEKKKWKMEMENDGENGGQRFRGESAFH